MNCVLLAFPLTVLLAAPALAQEPAPVDQDFWVSTRFLVQGTGVDGKQLAELLNEIGALPAFQQTVATAYETSGEWTRFVFKVDSMLKVAPNTQVLGQLGWGVHGTKAPKQTDAAAAAVAGFLQERLEQLLLGPELEAFSQQQQRAEQASAAAEQQYQRLSEHLAALGFDDFDAAQHALADLQQKRLDVDLDFRTEQSMQERLQVQMQRAEEQIREGQRQLASLLDRSRAAQEQVQSMGATPAAQRGGDFAAKLARAQAESRDLEFQIDDWRRTAARAKDLYEGAAGQLTSSTLALLRDQSRKQVLDELIERQQKVVADAAHRSRECASLQRQLEIARSDADALRALWLELRQQQQALQPVRVTVWK